MWQHSIREEYRLIAKSLFSMGSKPVNLHRLHDNVVSSLSLGTLHLFFHSFKKNI